MQRSPKRVPQHGRWAKWPQCLIRALSTAGACSMLPERVPRASSQDNGTTRHSLQAAIKGAHQRPKAKFAFNAQSRRQPQGSAGRPESGCSLSNHYWGPHAQVMTANAPPPFKRAGEGVDAEFKGRQGRRGRRKRGCRPQWR